MKKLSSYFLILCLSLAGSPLSSASLKSKSAGKPPVKEDKDKDFDVPDEGSPDDEPITINDSEIAGVVFIANNSEVKLGQLALKQGKSKTIKNFSQQMITDYQKANKNMKALASRLRLKDDDSEMRMDLKTAAQASELRIKDLSGRTFDESYIDEQVLLHQWILDSIDENLLPNVHDSDLKTYLKKWRSLVDKHSDRALVIQASGVANYQTGR